MSNLTLILLAAGSSSRFSKDVKKQWLRVGHKPLWQFVADNLQETGFFSQIIIVAAKDEIEFMKLYASYQFVIGGATRQESLKNALEIVKNEYTLVNDIARACISSSLLERILSKKGSADVIVPALEVTDTVVYEKKTIKREAVKRIQTPQLSHTASLKKALQTTEIFTDESSAIVANGGSREFVQGEENAHKITYLQDINRLACLQPPSSDIFSGNGFDVHAFDRDGKMWLGGVEIASEFGFKAHSDGDVAIHALIDALLGASGMGDIGDLFPDTEDIYKDIDSKELLKNVVKKIHNFGFVVVNADITIIAQKPRLNNYKREMRNILAKILKIGTARMNIKATTTEKLGFIGREEGIGVIANANLKYLDWKTIKSER